MMIASDEMEPDEKQQQPEIKPPRLKVVSLRHLMPAVQFQDADLDSGRPPGVLQYEDDDEDGDGDKENSDMHQDGVKASSIPPLSMEKRGHQLHSCQSSSSLHPSAPRHKEGGLLPSSSLSHPPSVNDSTTVPGQISAANPTPTTTSTSKNRPLAYLAPEREAYLRKYLENEGYPVSLHVRIQTYLNQRMCQKFYEGEFVEVRSRLMPGESKFGGLGHITHVHPDDRYDVKYAAGTREKMVEGVFIISRANDDGTKSRKRTARCLGCGAFQHECRCVRRSSSSLKRRSLPFLAAANQDQGRRGSSSSSSSSKPSARPSSLSPATTATLTSHPATNSSGKSGSRAVARWRSSTEEMEIDDEQAEEEEIVVQRRKPLKGGAATTSSDGSSSENDGLKQGRELEDSSDSDDALSNGGGGTFSFSQLPVIIRGPAESSINKKNKKIVQSDELEDESSTSKEKGVKRRKKTIAADDSEDDDDDMSDFSNSFDAIAARRRIAREKEARDEEDESNREEAQRLSRAAEARAYAAGAGRDDEGFIREEGQVAAEGATKEVRDIIRKLGLRKLKKDKEALAKRTGKLIRGFGARLLEYRTRLDAIKRRIDAKLAPAQRGQCHGDQAVEEVVNQVEELLDSLDDKMVSFTWETSDVLKWCIRHVRAKDAEPLGLEVDNFDKQLGEIDRACREHIKVVWSDLTDLGFRSNLPTLHEDLDEQSSEEEGEAEEGGGDDGGPGRQPYQDDGAYVVRRGGGKGSNRRRRHRGGCSSSRRGGAKREKGAGGGQPTSRSKKRRSEEADNTEEDEKGDDSDGEGSIGDFIVDDRGRERRRRDEKAGGGGSRKKRGRADGAEREGGGEGPNGSSASSLSSRGCSGGGLDPNAEGNRRKERQRRDRRNAAGANGMDIADDDDDDGIRRVYDHDDLPAHFWDNDNEVAVTGRGAGGVERKEQPLSADGVGEDIEAVLGAEEDKLGRGEEIEGQVPWERIAIPPSFESRPCRVGPTAENGIVTILGGLKLKLGCTWMSRPRPILTIMLLPRIHMCLSMLGGGRVGELSTNQLEASGLVEGLEAISCHLRIYGHRYSTSELAEVTSSLRLHGLQIDQSFCSEGMLKEEEKPIVTAVFYWYLLDWFTILIGLECRTSTSLSTSSCPAKAFVRQFVMYVLCQLVNRSMKDPLSLSLRLGASAITSYGPLASPIGALWYQVYRILEDKLGMVDAKKSFWSRFSQVTRARECLGDQIQSIQGLRSALQADDLEVLVRTAGSGVKAPLPASDLPQTEVLWKLTFELVRLELLANKLAPPRPSPPSAASVPTKSRKMCWMLAEALIRSANLDLLSSKPSKAANLNDDDDAPVCPSRYMALIVRRLRALLTAWKPEGDLIPKLWVALIHASAIRFEEEPAPRPAFTPLSVVKELMKMGDQATSWTTDWSLPRETLWDLSDPRYCPLPAYMILPPPHFLRELPRGDAIRRLVSRGCDELLLLGSCLLERYMTALPTPDGRRAFLLDLLPPLERSAAEKASSSTAAAATGGGKNIESSAQMIGLHNLGMAVLVMVDKGQAEQKVLVNFWRQLKQLCSKGRSDPDPAVVIRWEQGMALSIQFLAHVGPSMQDNPDFSNYNTIYDNLKQWLKNVQRPAAEYEALCAANLGSTERFSKLLLWAVLQALTLLVQFTAASPLKPKQLQEVWLLLGQFLGHCRDLDDATLSLILRAYHTLCPLPRAPTLSSQSLLAQRLPQIVVNCDAEDRASSTSLLWQKAQEQQQYLLQQQQRVEVNEEKIPLMSLIGLLKEAWEALPHSSVTGLMSTTDGSSSSATASSTTPTRSRLNLALHALTSLRAVAASLAMMPGKKRSESLYLLRSSFEAKPATYRDPQAARLRLLAPCFFDAYLGYNLPTFPCLERHEVQLLAAWIGLSLESSSWFVGLGRLSGGGGGAAVTMMEPSEMEIMPDRYLRRRFWSFTARLWTCLRFCEGSVEAQMLDLTSLGRDIVVPGMEELPAHGRGAMIERDMTIRLILLANVCVGGLRGLTGCQGVLRNERKSKIVQILGHLGGVLRLLIGSPAAPQPRPQRLLAYAVSSLVLRLNAEAIHEKLLDELTPALFGSFIGCPLGPSSNTNRAIGSTGLGDQSAVEVLAMMAKHVGDLIRCLALVKYSREPLSKWLRYLCHEGMLLASSKPEWQTKLFRSLANGLWHMCPCNNGSDGALAAIPVYPLFQSREEREATAGGAARSRSTVLCYEHCMHKLILLEPSSALIKQYETSHQGRLNSFRWQFIFELNLAANLLLVTDLSSDNDQQKQKEEKKKALALLSFLTVLYRPQCTCGRNPQAQLGLCPAQDLFPLMGPLAGRLLRSVLVPSCPFFLPSLRLIGTLLTCRLEGRVDDSRTVWQWANEGGMEIGGHPRQQEQAGLRLGAAAAAAAAAAMQYACHEKCQDKLKALVIQWGGLIGLLCTARYRALQYGGGQGGGAAAAATSEGGKLDLLIEETRVKVTKSYMEVEVMRQSSFYTAKSHVWGERKDVGDAVAMFSGNGGGGIEREGEGGQGSWSSMSSLGLRYHSNSGGVDEEDLSVMKQVKKCLLNGANESLAAFRPWLELIR